MSRMKRDDLKKAEKLELDLLRLIDGERHVVAISALTGVLTSIAMQMCKSREDIAAACSIVSHTLNSAWDEEHSTASILH